MIGYIFRNENGSLYFTEYGNHARKDLEKGKWVLGKGAHALSINPGAFPEVRWEDESPRKIELQLVK